MHSQSADNTLYQMDAEEYRKKLEIDILKIMEEKLQKGEMTAERARAIARMVLDALHPPLTIEQIYKIAPTLDSVPVFFPPL